MPRIVHELMHRVHEDKKSGACFSIQVQPTFLENSTLSLEALVYNCYLFRILEIVWIFLFGGFTHSCSSLPNTRLVSLLLPLKIRIFSFCLLRRAVSWNLPFDRKVITLRHVGIRENSAFVI